MKILWQHIFIAKVPEPSGHADVPKHAGPAEPEPAHTPVAPVVTATKIKRYKSPAEWLDMLGPPKCKIFLNKNDHRWTCVYKHQSDLWEGDFKFKHFSRSFDSSNLENVWEKLKEVHSRAWQKYALAAAEIGPCEKVQTPGQIEPEVLEGLKPEIKDLPEKTFYRPLKV